MKIEIDKRGRKLYKFNHSVHQGGFFYSHKTLNSTLIKNKEGLRNALDAIAKKFELIDVAIKIYDSIFFFFFMTKPMTQPKELIESIHNNLSNFGEWDKEYLHNTVYDLQEKYLRKDLDRFGFDYDKG
ncbi:MAG: hypothetical protein KKC54_08095 [Nanoarchaeota archaeon]|nr:hypothetical protein [Nanoarchaeota archaeon]MBU1946897.1 hypothetical protein [Nanoarchaeota archaeon]